MARSRTIKPGFFTNDLLAECDPIARILFQGLWCHADREGRLVFRPKKIKAEILPYDDADVGKLISQLSERGFVEVYEIKNCTYIQVVNFTKHQSPHMKEPGSVIPEPSEHQISTEPDTEDNHSSRASSFNPFPIPISPLPTPGADAQASVPATREIAEKFVVIWREELGGFLEAPRKLTDDRLKACRLRYFAEFAQDFGGWRTHCQAIRGSPFCLGENDRSWRADFDWALRPKTILRVSEGKYRGPVRNNGFDGSIALPEQRAPSKPPPTIEDLQARRVG